MRELLKYIFFIGLALFVFHSCGLINDISTYRDREEKKETEKIYNNKRKPGTTVVETEKVEKKEKKVTTAEFQLRDNIVAYSQKFEGTKYQYAGRSPKSGFDCSGFTHYVMKNFDISLSPSSSAQAKEGKRIKAEDAQPGDIIVFGKDGRINHVGLVYSNAQDVLKVIHSTSRGVVIDNIYSSKYWKPRVMYGIDIISNN